MRGIAFVVILTVAGSSVQDAFAADARKIRGINIGAQAVVTLVTAAIQGNLRGGRDVARCLLSGAVSGYGFYEAKVMIGNGDTQSGWIIANVAGSLSENAAAGRHPIAQLGYTVGPFRLRVGVPGLDRDSDSYVFVDVSQYEALKAIQAMRDNDRGRFRSGLVAFERDTVYERQGNLITVGRAYGIYPGVWIGADETTWPHEVIHAVQSLQADVLDPAVPFLTYKPDRRPDDRKRLIRLEHLKLGLFNLTNDQVLGNQRYENRWVEIEAYRLAQDREPTPSP